ncbi:GNAT family N-acetyltransferase [Iamia sp. SCSIO 61187]|uniref:GNAT family N-acetyltransferase n=1 Tax=Iamia sp. SCSIO 61187 TaxID=2722752 RepID=UPI001C633633|nr:GNAT family N-acetyltransferase [Iamia sp. SCSIO 61187]QYG94171.1 GNAT family N-acetyltransferase [Iamia sp. SCSIO 61187]
MGFSTRKRDRSTPGVPPPVTVRRLGPGDDAVLSHLAVANATFGTVDEREPLQPLTEAETVAFLADDRTATFVAFAGDEPVGFCYANELYRRHTALRHLCIYEVGVAERFRNQGIGAALLEAVGDHARSRGITRGFVITNASDTSAASLYASAGGIRTADDDVIFAFSWR